MANDSIAGLQSELEAALAVLDPEIRGISDLCSHPITPALGDQLQIALIELQQRRALIQTVLDDIAKLLADIEALEADGYPTPQTFSMSGELMNELAIEISEAEAGASVFQAMATAMRVTVGSPVPKVDHKP